MTHRIIDADGHIVEPPATFADYLPRQYQSYAPRIVQFEDHFRFICNDRMGFKQFAKIETLGAPGQTATRTDTPVVAQGADNPHGRLVDLDLEGMDQVVIFPTYGLMVQGVTEREPALALCQSVNDWLGDYCAIDRRRLLGVVTLPMTCVEDAVAEVERCLARHGFVAAFRRPEVIPGLPKVHDPHWDPLWALLQEANLPVCVHPGLAGVLPYDFYRDRFDDHFGLMHAPHFPVESMMNLTAFIGYGTLERFPGLRLALLESGAVWALPYVHRLDEHQEMFGFPVELPHRPSDYFRRQCFVAVEEAEPGLDAMMREYPDSVVFASDYPHGDGTFPGAAKALLDTELLTDEHRWKVLRHNAQRLYALKES